MKYRTTRRSFVRGTAYFISLLGFGAVFTRRAWAQFIGSSFWKIAVTTPPLPSYQLWATGMNSAGDMGQGDRTNRSSPVQIPGTWAQVCISGGVPPILLGAEGNAPILALKPDSTLWAWGLNTYGQLGQSDVISRSSPVQISGSWSQAVTNLFHTLAIRKDGSLWAFGDNSYGELGTGNTVSRSSPVQIPGSWSQIAVTYMTTKAGSFGIRSDGTLWNWGYCFADNGYHSSPVQVGGSWSQIFGTNQGSVFGLKADGTLWAWGTGTSGALGLGNSTTYSSPMQVPGSWSKISVSTAVSAGIKSDGTLWMWGSNSYGQLGQNNRTLRSSPVQVAGSWTQISISSSTSAGIKSNGTVWAWGSNYIGQLGLGTNGNYYSSPVQISGGWKEIHMGGPFFLMK